MAGKFLKPGAIADNAAGRDIRFVARPDERDLKIQRVVQVGGLRGPRPHQR